MRGWYAERGTWEAGRKHREGERRTVERGEKNGREKRAKEGINQ